MSCLFRRRNNSAARSRHTLRSVEVLVNVPSRSRVVDKVGADECRGVRPCFCLNFERFT